MDKRKLTWLDGWDMASFNDVEEYGVLHFFPGDKFGVYCKATNLVVAITEGWPMSIDMLGLEVNSPQFFMKLGNCHMDCQAVA